MGTACAPSFVPTGKKGLWWALLLPLSGAIALGLVFQTSRPGATPPLAVEPTPEPPQPTVPTAFYFLADSAYGNPENAANRVRALTEQGYAEAGRLTPGDFANVRNNLHLVYAGRYPSLEACMAALTAYAQTVPDAYCALASNEVGADDTRHFAPKPPVEPAPPPTDTVEKPTIVEPAAAIREYYDLINERRYKPAWARLTPEFQQGRAGSYSSFFLWWETVAKVEVLETKEVMADNDRALVVVTLRYHMKNDRTETERLQVQLVLMPGNLWAIAATEYL
ncbi:MAG: hypothetical protein ACUVSQ_02255 [Pseudanabaenaceae cyanobacterium]